MTTAPTSFTLLGCVTGALWLLWMIWPFLRARWAQVSTMVYDALLLEWCIALLANLVIDVVFQMWFAVDMKKTTHLNGPISSAMMKRTLTQRWWNSFTPGPTLYHTPMIPFHSVTVTTSITNRSCLFTISSVVHLFFISWLYIMGFLFCCFGYNVYLLHRLGIIFVFYEIRCLKIALMVLEVAQ